MCKTHPYEFGERLTINYAGNANCQECGMPVQSWMQSVECTYAGNYGEGCMFTFLEPQRCPSCGKYATGHLEYCGVDGDNDGLHYQVSEPVETHIQL